MQLTKRIARATQLPRSRVVTSARGRGPVFPEGHGRRRWRRVKHLLPRAGLAIIVSTATGHPQSTSDLATVAQNPIASIYSLPFQNNILGGIGQKQNVANQLNIQPVVAVNLGSWNIISRTILPVVYLPQNAASLTLAAAFGIGDINQSPFVSPDRPGAIIWGVGPSFSVPSATSRVLGSGRFGAGPTAVVLATPKPWVVGLLGRQLWSIGGSNRRAGVSQALLQPFVNYNFPSGWYLTSSPIITADLKSRDHKWSVPIGGGIGKIFKVAGQAINAQLQGFEYVERVRIDPHWEIRCQVQFLFPR